MKAYAQFIDKEGNRILGSDGIFPLDGRWNFYTATKKAEIQQWRLRNVKPWIAGFRIMRGNKTFLAHGRKNDTLF